jgi:putative endonuclease
MEAAGYRILEKNYRSRYGEIDLIAESPEKVIVFVEVKARSGTAFGSGGSAVTPAKQRKIIDTARRYIANHRLSWQQDYRFDVIIFENHTENHTMEHIENAFF